MTTMSLEEILVDPTRFSARAVAVDEAMVADLAADAGEGRELPPLKVVIPVDRNAAWCACQKRHTQQGLAAWRARMERTPHGNLPTLPEAVLYDGTTIYWALRAAGVTSHPVEIHIEPVAGVRDVLALALAANNRNSRRLTDTDLRVTFARLWLGREVYERNETWSPGLDGMDCSRIAELVGKSAGWVSQMKAYLKVHYRVKLDLGLGRSYALSQLDPDLWKAFVWEGEALRLVPRLDDKLRPRADCGLATIPELTVKEVERLVQRAQMREQPTAPAEDAAPTLKGQAKLPLAEAECYQGELPLVWDPVRTAMKTLYEAAPRLDLEQTRAAYEAYRPIYIEAVATWERLQERAKRLGVLED